jgi:putative ABC transport system ATP-binding protein
MIGFVFQTYNLLPRLTALQNVELPLIYGNVKNRRQLASEALNRVGLSDRGGHLPAELSGGQQQRVGIARALATEPSVLLADEPTGNLDSHSTNEIIKIIQDLNQSQGLTVILVTHETEIAALANRSIDIVDGSIVEDKKNN